MCRATFVKKVYWRHTKDTDSEKEREWKKGKNEIFLITLSFCSYFFFFKFHTGKFICNIKAKEQKGILMIWNAQLLFAFRILKYATITYLLHRIFLCNHVRKSISLLRNVHAHYNRVLHIHRDVIDIPCLSILDCTDIHR